MLPPSPWTTEALVRLCASILLGMICLGGVGGPLITVASHPWKPEALPVLGWAAAGMISLGLALWWLGQPLSREKVMRRFLLLMISLYGGLLFVWLGADAAQAAFGQEAREASTAAMVLSVLGFQGFALVLVWRSLHQFGMSWAEAFGLDRAPWRAILAGTAFAVLFTPIAWAMQGWIALLMEQFRMDAAEQPAVEVLRTAQSSGSRIILGIAAVLIAPIAEEVLFRGILYPFIKTRGHPQFALWGTSVMFAMIHVNMAAFVPLMALSLLLVWIYEKTGNLLAPIIAHMAFNALNLGLLYSL